MSLAPTGQVDVGHGGRVRPGIGEAHAPEADAVVRCIALGSLAPGKLADLVVLDRDVFRCDPSEIVGTRVLATMINGPTNSM